MLEKLYVPHKWVTLLRSKSLWRISNIRLNDEQWAAFEHIDRLVLLTTGPGFEKARLFLWRAVNLLIFYEIKPREIYLSTFTGKAAYQVEETLNLARYSIQEMEKYG